MFKNHSSRKILVWLAVILISLFIIIIIANFVTDDIIYNADDINSKAAKVQKEARGHIIPIKNDTYTLKDIKEAKHVMEINDIDPSSVNNDSHTKWSDNYVPKDTLTVLIKDNTSYASMQEAGYMPGTTKYDTVYTSPNHPQTHVDYKKNKQYEKVMNSYRNHLKYSYCIKIALTLLMVFGIFYYLFAPKSSNDSNDDIWIHIRRN